MRTVHTNENHAYRIFLREICI